MNMAVWEDPASSTMPYCRKKAVGQAWRLKVPWVLQPLPREGTGAQCTTRPHSNPQSTLLPCQCPAAPQYHLAEAGFAQPSLALLGPHLPKEGTAWHVTGSGILAILECYLEQHRDSSFLGKGTPLSAAQGLFPHCTLPSLLAAC